MKPIILNAVKLIFLMRFPRRMSEVYVISSLHLYNLHHSLYSVFSANFVLCEADSPCGLIVINKRIKL
jgi:hypothetical protein